MELLTEAFLTNGESSAVADDEPPSGPSHTGDTGSCLTLFPDTPDFQIDGNNVRPLPPRRYAFPYSDRSAAFYSRFFPDSSPHDWADWRWQLKNRVTTVNALERIITLTADERAAVNERSSRLPFSITPYYLSLITDGSPLRATVIPSVAERKRAPGEEDDPLAEDSDSPVPGLIHRYPDRVLFLVTEFCSVFCRYCTRSRMVGEKRDRSGAGYADWQRAIDYIAAHPEIRDVIISGGDPLTMSTDRLEWLLARLRAIAHVEVIRIGTKVPMVLPQRITTELVNRLKKYHPLWMSIHCTHPDELTGETLEALKRLANAGIPLGSQTVLLKNVNDGVGIMKELMHGLMRSRVRPYYLYQCDPITGSSHFRTPVSSGVDIIEGLRGHTSGYAVPHFVIDAPGGGGKIPLLPEYVQGRNPDGSVVLRNYEGHAYIYPD